MLHEAYCIVTAQTVKTRNTFNAAGPAPTNSTTVMQQKFIASPP